MVTERAKTTKLEKTIIQRYLIVLGLIVFFHLFKIRYLDYYITIEDKNSLEKTIEKPIEITEKPKKEYLEAKRKEKIIIRDPKHSTFSFFEFLSKILLFILKIFDFIILIFIVIAFIISLITFFFFMWHLKYGIIFFYIMLTILGLILITYVFFELFYNFLISKKQHFKRIFILILISFIVFSLGISSTTVAFLNLKNTQQFNYLTETFTIEMQDNLVLLDDNYFNMNVEYVFDENEKDIKINLNYPEYINLYLNNYQENNYFIYLFHFNSDFFKTYNLILNHLKEGKILNFNNLENYNLKITISSENYQKLITNKENHLYSFSFN